MANYGDIKQHVRDVTHRADLTDSLMDVWKDTLQSRINDELMASSLLTKISVTPTTNPFGVAEFFPISGRVEAAYQIVNVAYTNSSGNVVNLQPASYEQLRLWANDSGGDPRFYAINGYELFVSPFKADTTYAVVAYVDVKPMNADADADVVSNLHPNIYYYGMLQQAYEYLRDFTAADRYAALFENEIQRVNRTAAWRHAPTSGQMQGASSWV